VPKLCSRRRRSLPREQRPRTHAMAPHDNSVLDVNKALAPHQHTNRTTESLRKLALQSRQHLNTAFARTHHSALEPSADAAITVGVRFTRTVKFRTEAPVLTQNSKNIEKAAIHPRCPHTLGRCNHTCRLPLLLPFSKTSVTGARACRPATSSNLDPSFSWSCPTFHRISPNSSRICIPPPGATPIIIAAGEPAVSREL
jgi:hypothetical protein